MEQRDASKASHMAESGDPLHNTTEVEVVVDVSDFVVVVTVVVTEEEVVEMVVVVSVIVVSVKVEDVTVIVVCV